MNEMRKLKDLIAPGMTATFVSARRGDLIYRIGTFTRRLVLPGYKRFDALVARSG